MDIIDELNESIGSNGSMLIPEENDNNNNNFFGDHSAISRIIAQTEPGIEEEENITEQPQLFSPETIPVNPPAAAAATADADAISQAIEGLTERVQEQLQQPANEVAAAAAAAAATPEFLNSTAISNLPLETERLLKPRSAPYQVPKKKIGPPQTWMDNNARIMKTFTGPSRAGSKKIMKKNYGTTVGKSKTDEDLPTDFYQIFNESEKKEEEEKEEEYEEEEEEKEPEPSKKKKKSPKKKKPKPKPKVKVTALKKGETEHVDVIDDIVDLTKKKNLKRKARPKKLDVPKEKKSKPIDKKRPREETPLVKNKIATRKKKQTKLDDDAK